MDCRSLKRGYKAGYPGCNIKFSKTIDWDSADDIAKKIFSIISAQYPKQVGFYGLYLDNHYLLLPTNGE